MATGTGTGTEVPSTSGYFSWDRTTLRSRVQSELGYTGTLATAEATIWNEKLNMSVNDVIRAFPWGFTDETATYTCTADTSYIVLDQDFLELCMIDLIVYEAGEGGEPVKLVPQETFLREGDLDYDDTGVPLVATLRYDAATRRWRIYLKPIPAEAYSLTVTQRVLQQLMTDDAATIPTPAEMHDLVLLNAKWRIARQKNRPDQATHYAQYREQLADYKKTLGERGQGGDWRFHDPVR